MADYDVIVIGAGSMGMAAGYYLAKAGQKTLMIDAFDPPHTFSSHEGDTRYISAASGEGGPYVPLTLRSVEVYDEMQKKSGEQLFVKNGAMTFGVPDSNFVRTAMESAKEYNIDVEYFESGSAFRKRWPDLNFDDDMHGILEPNTGGTLSLPSIIRVFRLYALDAGAELQINNPVLDLKIADNEVTVVTQDGTYTSNKVVVTPGPFINKFIGKLGLDDLVFEPSRRALGWFDAEIEDYAIDRFPAFYGDSRLGVYYGFPTLREFGFKIGKFYEPDETEPWADNLEPEYINKDFGAFKRDERELRKFLGAYMPGANGHMLDSKIGMWTNTSDENYVIDFHPEYDNVVVAAGFSGNGAKAVPAVGEIIQQLITEGESELDISDFTITRDALKIGFSELEESATFGALKNV